jgi:WD40 repeat protein
MTLLNLPFEKFKESNDFPNTILNKNACSINYEFRDIFIKEKNSKITQIIDKGDGITFFISLFKEISRSSMIIGKYYNDLLETTTIPIINVISFIKINEYLITLSSNCKNIYNINKKIASKNIKNEDNIKLIINYIGNKFIGVSQTDIFIYEFIPKNNDDEPEINMLKKITLEGQEDLMRSQMNDINYQNMKNNIEKSSKSPKRKNSNENILKNKYDFDIMPEVYITAIKFIEDPYLLKSKNESYMSALFIGNNKGNVKIYKKSKDDNFYYHDSINFKDGEITNIFELREKIIITTSSINDCNMFIYDKKENLIKDKADKHIFSDEGISFIQSLTNTILITGSSKGLISIWDINTLSLLNRFKNNDIKDNMTSLCVLKKTQIIISSYSKGQIVIWSVADEENLPIEN